MIHDYCIDAPRTSKHTRTCSINEHAIVPSLSEFVAHDMRHIIAMSTCQGVSPCRCHTHILTYACVVRCVLFIHCSCMAFQAVLFYVIMRTPSSGMHLTTACTIQHLLDKCAHLFIAEWSRGFLVHVCDRSHAYAQGFSHALKCSCVHASGASTRFLALTRLLNCAIFLVLPPLRTGALLSCAPISAQVRSALLRASVRAGAIVTHSRARAGVPFASAELQPSLCSVATAPIHHERRRQCACTRS
jgi:hypothetical protein